MVCVFHGVDDKSGVTMLAQSVAEGLADAHGEGKVGFIGLNGKPSLDYFRDADVFVDTLKSRLESRIFSPQELLSYCGVQQKLRYVGGIRNEDEERYYQPEIAAFLLDIAERAFEVTVVDAGNRLDNGLALGALRRRATRVFVITQNEACLARWEKRRDVYEKLAVMPKAFVLNRYMEKDFYPVDYVAKRLKADAPVLRLAYSREGRRAEIERKPLTRLDPTYRRDIGKLLRAMAEEGGQARKARYGEGIWKNFISNAIWRKK